MRDGPLPPEFVADLDSARALTLVALVVDGIFAGTLGLIALGLASFGDSGGAALFAVLAVVLVGLLLLTYVLVYAPVGDARVDAARNPALVLAIVSLLLTGVAGVLLILVYVKLDRLRTLFRLARHGWLTPPAEAGPSPPRFCPACGAPLASPEAPCPECGHRLRPSEAGGDSTT